MNSDTYCGSKQVEKELDDAKQEETKLGATINDLLHKVKQMSSLQAEMKDIKKNIQLLYAEKAKLNKENEQLNKKLSALNDQKETLNNVPNEEPRFLSLKQILEKQAIWRTSQPEYVSANSVLKEAKFDKVSPLIEENITNVSTGNSLEIIKEWEQPTSQQQIQWLKYQESQKHFRQNRYSLKKFQLNC